jgi:Methyltransferase domain.
MNWKIKGLIQKVLSAMPGGVELNTWLQQSVGGLREFDDNIDAKLDCFRQSLVYLRDVGFDWRGAILMEIGSGWYPTFPVCFHLAGAGSIKTFDVTRLMNEGMTLRMLGVLESRLERLSEWASQPFEEVRARYQRVRGAGDLAALLRQAGIEYFAPTDARNTGLADNSIDLVYSNSVMEHVPEEVIRGLMTESLRVLKPGALALHNVGCNDHYAFSDKNISFVNYLRYDDEQWKLWTNRLQYQNRLRAPEFSQLATSAGLEVIYTHTATRKGSLDDVQRMTVAPRFRRFTPEQLAMTTIDFISRKPSQQGG